MLNWPRSETYGTILPFLFKFLQVVAVTSNLNNNIIKGNLTPDNIKSQVAEYKVTPYSYPRYLKENTKAHYNAYNPKGVRDSQYSK